MATPDESIANTPKASKPKVKSPTAKQPKSAAGFETAAVAKIAPATGTVDHEPVSPVKNEFASLKDKAGERAREAADRGKDKASEALGGVGKILRESAETIDDKVGPQYGDYARKAADAVDEFAGKMDAKQVDDIMEDTRQFVRKSPAVAIGAAAAIGFVLARLVRSGRD